MRQAVQFFKGHDVGAISFCSCVQAFGFDKWFFRKVTCMSQKSEHGWMVLLVQRYLQKSSKSGWWKIIISTYLFFPCLWIGGGLFACLHIFNFMWLTVFKRWKPDEWDNFLFQRRPFVFDFLVGVIEFYIKTAFAKLAGCLRGFIPFVFAGQTNQNIGRAFLHRFQVCCWCAYSNRREGGRLKFRHLAGVYWYASGQIIMASTRADQAESGIFQQFCFVHCPCVVIRPRTIERSARTKPFFNMVSWFITDANSASPWASVSWDTRVQELAPQRWVLCLMVCKFQNDCCFIIVQTDSIRSFWFQFHRFFNFIDGAGDGGWVFNAETSA